MHNSVAPNMAAGGMPPKACAYEEHPSGNTTPDALTSSGAPPLAWWDEQPATAQRNNQQPLRNPERVPQTVALKHHNATCHAPTCPLPWAVASLTSELTKLNDYGLKHVGLWSSHAERQLK